MQMGHAGVPAVWVRALSLALQHAQHQGITQVCDTSDQGVPPLLLLLPTACMWALLLYHHAIV
jgi:hypothetical protein